MHETVSTSALAFDSFSPRAATSPRSTAEGCSPAAVATADAEPGLRLNAAADSLAASATRYSARPLSAVAPAAAASCSERKVSTAPLAAGKRSSALTKKECGRRHFLESQ